MTTERQYDVERIKAALKRIMPDTPERTLLLRRVYKAWHKAEAQAKAKVMELPEKRD